jgi:hypothetical protein
VVSCGFTLSEVGLREIRKPQVAGTKQIDRVITDFGSGLFRIENVKPYDIGRIYPVIVTAESLPQEFFTRAELDKMIEEARVFQNHVVAPLLCFLLMN